MIVLHRTRPLVCLAGLHQPAWIWDPQYQARGMDHHIRVCGRCGVMLTGRYWDDVAPLPGTQLRLTPALLAVALGAAAGVVLAHPHRSRR